MMPGINTEVQSAGGGYGGFGNGENPLLWLITLGFLGRGNLLGGDSGAAGAAGIARANEGISCLASGQQNIQTQQQFDRISDNLIATGNRTVSAVGDLSNDFNSFSRDLNTTLCNGFNDTQVRDLQSNFALSKQISDCCCDTKAGLKEIETAICHQTNQLTNVGNANTQRIVDLLTGNKIQELESQLNDCKTSKTVLEQTAAIISAINTNCPAPAKG